MVQQPASQQSLFKQLWDGYKEFIIAVPSALLLLIIIIIIVVHVTHKRKHMAYNHAELKAWIKKEMDMGTSKEETRQILAEHTGWSEDEISRTFSEFGDVNAPTSPGPSVDNLQ